jgi:LysM domain
MKRTTIFPSNGRTLLVAATLGVAAAPLVAQDTTTTARSDVHVVQRGETLWALAERYLGDPFLWPEIYRLNPSVIEDPHWIFPGEVLRLAPGDELVAVQPTPADSTPPGDVVQLTPPRGEVLTPDAAPAPPPPPTSAQTETVFARNRRRVARTTFVPTADRGRRTTTRSQFYAGGFLTEEESLPWTRVLGITDESTLSTLRVPSSAMIQQSVRLMAPTDATFRVGDSLVVAYVDRELADWGEIVHPTGVVQVTAASGRELQARVIMQFTVIEGGQVALPVDPFRDRVGTRTVPIENGMEGSIVAARDEQPLADLDDVLFIDRGRQDGVTVGDEFEVLLSREGFADAPDRRVGLLLIVHVRERSATGLLIEVHDISIGAGSPVRLIRKMPS